MTKEQILESYKFWQSQDSGLTRDTFIKASGIPKRSIDKQFGSFSGLKSAALNKPETPPESSNDDEVIQVSGEGVKSLEELASYSKIDLAKWDATKFSVSLWDNKTSVKAEFKKKIEEEKFDDLLSVFIEQANAVAPSSFTYDKPRENGKLLLLQLSDVHLGKGCDAKETGWADYDISKAKEYYKKAVEELVNSANPEEIGTILLIAGSDFFHYENEKVCTTSGTSIEGVGTWYNMYNEGCQLMTEVIEKLAQRFRVEVLVVCGNHARLSEYAMGSYIKAYFRNHWNVNVNNEPAPRKYFGFGKTLIGFNHGDSGKLADLPLIMMRENQKIVSNFEQFLFLSAHLHSDKLTDVHGVRVMVCPALCPPDVFHSKNNWVGNVQSGQALVFAEWGLEKILYSKPPC